MKGRYLWKYLKVIVVHRHTVLCIILCKRFYLAKIFSTKGIFDFKSSFQPFPEVSEKYSLLDSEVVSESYLEV